MLASDPLGSHMKIAYRGSFGAMREESDAYAHHFMVSIDRSRL